MHFNHIILTFIISLIIGLSSLLLVIKSNASHPGSIVEEDENIADVILDEARDDESDASGDNESDASGDDESDVSGDDESTHAISEEATIISRAYKDVARAEKIDKVVLLVEENILDPQRADDGIIDEEEENEFAATIVADVSLELRVKARVALESIGHVIQGRMTSSAVLLIAQARGVAIDQTDIFY